MACETIAILHLMHTIVVVVVIVVMMMMMMMIKKGHFFFITMLFCWLHILWETASGSSFNKNLPHCM